MFSKNQQLSPNATPEERYKMQVYYRHRMRLKLLQDIQIDIEVCRLEGWDPKEYIRELQDLLNSFKI